MTPEPMPTTPAPAITGKTAPVSSPQQAGSAARPLTGAAAAAALARQCAIACKGDA